MIDPQPVPGPLLLIADDDEDILELLGLRLELAGYEVVRARHGDEALRLALERLPSLALLDVMMPGLDGYEVARRLRGDERTSAMPIILLTARAQASDLVRGLAAGADEHITKPFDARDLMERVDRLLRTRL